MTFFCKKLYLIRLIVNIKYMKETILKSSLLLKTNIEWVNKKLPNTNNKTKDILKYNSFWKPNESEKLVIDELEREDPKLFEKLKWNFLFKDKFYLIKWQNWYQMKVYKEELKWEKTIKQALSLITKWESVVTYSLKWLINWVDWRRYLNWDEVRYLHSIFKQSEKSLKFFLPLFLDLSNNQIISNMEQWDSKWLGIYSFSEWSELFNVHCSLNKFDDFNKLISYSLLPVCTKETWFINKW